MFVNHPPIPIDELNDQSQGELEHRRAKHFYKRTNRGVSFPHQIAKQERMQRHYRKYIETCIEKMGAESQSAPQSKTVNEEDRSPRKHYSISERSRGYLTLYQWAYGTDMDDPALKACVTVGFCGIPY